MPDTIQTFSPKVSYPTNEAERQYRDAAQPVSAELESIGPCSGTKDWNDVQWLNHDE